MLLGRTRCLEVSCPGELRVFNGLTARFPDSTSQLSVPTASETMAYVQKVIACVLGGTCPAFSIVLTSQRSACTHRFPVECNLWHMWGRLLRRGCKWLCQFTFNIPRLQHATAPPCPKSSPHPSTTVSAIC